MNDKKYIWINRFNLNIEQYTYRKKHKEYFGLEFPVDRFDVAPGLLEISCINIVKQPKYNLQNITKDFEDRYYSIINQVADNVYKMATNKKIHIFYSGGIDSVCVLASLIKHNKFKEFFEKKKFVICLTKESINEYPYLFQNFIQNKIPFEILNLNKVMNDPNALVVTGDIGDYIIGSTDALKFKFNNLMDDWTKLDIHNDLYLAAIKKCPFDIITINQYIWWLNQCFSFQDELIRYYVWTKTKEIQSLPNDNKVFRFFYDDLFTTFSYEYMSTNPKYSKVSELKEWPKKYICDFFKDDSYFNKQKINSQIMIPKKLHKNSLFLENDIIKYD
jgi:hypothetical protein